MEWILLAVFAGFSNGAFALPMKFTTGWNWENTWGAFIFWGFIVYPALLGALTVPGLTAVFREAGAANLRTIFMFGFLWGIGSICFGLGIRYLGIGLAFSLNIGVTIAIGSLLPLFLEETVTADEKSIKMVIAGVATIVTGVFISGYGAFLRGREQHLPVTKEVNGVKSPAGRLWVSGILLCLAAGIMSPMLQFAFMHGGSIIGAAAGRGVSETIASNAVWVVALSGGFAANIFYVVKLLFRNRSWSLYRIRDAGRYHMLAMLMGLFWVVTIACYGMAVSNLGALGLSVGWAIFNSVGIITANLLGLFTKEWQGVSKRTYTAVGLGLTVLVLGTCLVAAS
ncbi:MAG: hypothetical protein ABS46_01775 [Cytophagaceae bacterium SCN 52-12]|nr:MAG: hypothetical protein ABS46_01775 [Cytophagaceae bacterium SCN 52-12]